jgi:hypothetical protein
MSESTDILDLRTWLTDDELAVRLGITARTVRLNNSAPESVKGRRHRTSQASLQTWIHQQTQTVPAGSTSESHESVGQCSSGTTNWAHG